MDTSNNILTEANMNATQKKAVQVAVKHGFTWMNDSIFKSFRAGKTCINSLVSLGYLVKEETRHGIQYVPTEAARDFVTYGIEV
jgi:hypothetical protein